MTKNYNDIEQEVTALVKEEVTQFEDATVFVTEKVAFQMRNLVRQLRKNYWGVFDNPIDPSTGRKKIWTHLTKEVVEMVVKNIDLDTKDINFRATQPGAISDAAVIRHAVKNELDRMDFGEILDMLLRTKSIDGTGILKTWEHAKRVKTRIVDRLNFYIDPSARSIQEANSCIERHVTPLGEFKKMDFKNKDKVNGQADVPIADMNFNNNSYRGKSKFVELFERYGYAPEYFITGKDKDTDDIMTKIIVAKDGGNWVYLSCERWDGVKPYEEDWYTRMANRWDGEGVAEKVMMEQLYINIVRNIRINRAYTSQLGLFKMRRGSGITPQMLTKLSSNGIIPVNNMDDIQQLVMQEASQASYTDEANSENWARKITGAFESVTGETMPASTTATSAAISQQSGASQFVLIKEGTGMFLQRWVKRHVLPIVVKNLKLDDVIRCNEDYNKYEDMIKNIACNITAQHFDAAGQSPTFEEFQAVEQATIDTLKKRGTDVFIGMKNKLKEEDFDVKVYITNEDIDKSVIVNNLLQALPIAPEYRDQILKNVFDLFSLDFYPLQKMPVRPDMVEGMQGTPSQQPQGATQQTQMTEALAGQQTVA